METVVLIIKLVVVQFRIETDPTKATGMIATCMLAASIRRGWHGPLPSASQKPR